MGEKADQTPSPAAAGKQLDLDPTHGHTLVMPGEKNQDATDKRSIEDVVRNDPNPGMKPEDILSMENIPDDPKELEKLMGLYVGDKSREDAPEGDAPAHKIAERIESGEATAAAEIAPPKSDPAPAAKTPAAGSTPAAGATPPDGEYVESRDGKGKIPYAVLADTRRENARMAAELATLRAGTAAAPGTPATPAASAAETREATAAAAQAKAGMLSDEQIDALAEKYPAELIDVLKAVNNTARTAFGKVSEIETEATALENDELAASAQSVQDMIDQDPVLSKWQNAADTADWEEAVRLDDSLMRTRTWGGKPAVERFAEVKRLMGVEPAAVAPPTPAKAAPTLTAEQKAEAKLAAAGAKAAEGRAFSHTDLPGGNPPAQSEHEALASMSMMDLEKRFESMTPAKQRDYLARVS